MTTKKANGSRREFVELATFRVGQALCGIDILHIQEINKLMDMTAVPGSPGYVRGILNLRGQIVTIIDLQRKLGLPGGRLGRRTRNIIVAAKGESVGLLVSDIGDVVETHTAKVEPSPANIGEIQGRFFTGVAKTKDKLIGLLDLEQLLETDERNDEH